MVVFGALETKVSRRAFKASQLKSAAGPLGLPAQLHVRVWNDELQWTCTFCTRFLQSRKKCMIWCERSVKPCLLWPPEACEISFHPDGEQQIMLMVLLHPVPSSLRASSSPDTSGRTKTLISFLNSYSSAARLNRAALVSPDVSEQ